MASKRAGLELRDVHYRHQRVVTRDRRPVARGHRAFVVILLGLGVLLLSLHLTGKSVAGQRLDYNELRDDDDLVNAVLLANATEGQDSFAEMFDRVLEKEFPEKDPQEGTEQEVGKSFNNSVAEQQAVLETVARVTHEKPKRNDSQDERNGTMKSFQLHDLITLESESGADELPTLIDKEDNVFVISNPRSGYMVLQQDLRLISELVIVIVSAAIGGIVFAWMGQPVITGYLLAGSAIGPGGFSVISELVQVETIAQFGVIFLLFCLGLEFSTAKLRAVRAVAVFGGLLQILLFMCISGLIAMLCGGKSTEGVFVGAFLSMSSTAVVLKFLMEKNSVNSLSGQITVGTLVLQDCAVGLLFAMLPVLGGDGGLFQGIISMVKALFLLGTFILMAMFIARTLVPRFLRMMRKLSVPTNELFQLTAVAFCLLVAWCSDKLGLSLELGAFMAGVMISGTDQAEHTLEQIESIRNLFSALFLASIGMLINLQFLWNHMDILLASVILVIAAKTIVITFVVRVFGHSVKTSLIVGMSLAQIGEFAFVLLSRASNLHLVQRKLYLLLLGTTALSLITTPVLFRMIPALMHLGVLMNWFSPDLSHQEVVMKGDHLHTGSSRHISIAVPGSER